ncbi:MAG: VWA domain-containing protein [Chloroflexota bacterium]
MQLQFAFPLALLLFLLLAACSVLLSRFSRMYLPPARRRLSLALRLVLLALVTLAIAQPRIAVPENSLNVVFLVDASDSVGSSGVDQATAWIRQALGRLGAKDRAGVVVFGKDALVEEALTHSGQLPDLASAPVRSATDIGGAMRLGMAMLAGQGGKRLILLSDGNENFGSAVDEARIAALSGVQVSVAPVQRAPHSSVYVERVTVPNTVRKGERFDITGNVQSTVAGQGTLFLFTDGALTSQQTITLHPGANAFDFSHGPAAQGFHTFSVHLETTADATPENKQASSFGYVSGEPRVLLVEGQAGVGADLQKALTSVGMQVDRTAPTGVPADLAQLRSYDSITLVNVPATDLPASLMQTLQLYVQNLGGGLVTIGGDKSYASGQYDGTPLDAMLPVSSLVKPRQNLPSTAVVFVIESLENSLGIDISKEAAKSAIANLSSADQIAVNDTSGGWAVPLQNVTDKAAINAKIDAMQPSDPSSYAPALKDAWQALLNSPAKTKHIILMGDGDAADTYQPLMQSIAAAGITTSVVGTNVQPSDLAVLQDIATAGKGRYYDGNDPFDIPQLLVKETQLVARPAIVEEAFKPVVVGSSPVLRGIDPATLPPLLGYVATTAKPTAQQILESGQQDPLLAQWQYGLGHVLSWTSDSGGRWAGNWVSWPQYAAFWSQVVRESLPSNVDQNLQVSVTPNAQGAHIMVDAVAADQSYRNFLTTRATVVNPNTTQSAVPLEQTAPGRYEGDFPTADQGTYLLQIVQTDSQGRVVALQPTGYAVDYSPEYRDNGTNMALLQKLPQMTGGSVLASADQAFQHDLRGASGLILLWPWLLLTALLLFLADVAVRRLRLSTRELRALLSRANRRVRLADNEGRLAGLRQRMLESRAQSKAPHTAEQVLTSRLRRPSHPTSEGSLTSVAARLQEQRSQAAARHAGPATTIVRPHLPAAGDAPTATAPAAEASGTTRTHLLEAKQRARRNREE